MVTQGRSVNTLHLLCDSQDGPRFRGADCPSRSLERTVLPTWASPGLPVQPSTFANPLPPTHTGSGSTIITVQCLGPHQISTWGDHPRTQHCTHLGVNCIQERKARGREVTHKPVGLTESVQDAWAAAWWGLVGGGGKHPIGLSYSSWNLTSSRGEGRGGLHPPVEGARTQRS